jgi:hypothetical protein
MTLSVYGAYPAGMGERRCFTKHGDHHHTHFQTTLAMNFRPLQRKSLRTHPRIPQIWGVSPMSYRA